MTTHELKSWSQFFQPIKSGAKKHDLRKNDRKFKVGDLCRLREYDFAKGEYTDDEVFAEVTFITDKQFPCAFSGAVLAPEYCILSLEVRAKHTPSFHYGGIADAFEKTYPTPTVDGVVA